MDVKETINQLMQEKGPVLPIQVAKAIESNTLMASAHLSELSARKKVKISSLKIGSSPLYYLPGHESKLEDFSSNLHEKEQKAFELLKENKILQDSVQEPVIRAALRQIKDFAVPLQVNFKGQAEIFWKFHSLSSEEAETTIKSKINPTKGSKESEKQKTLPKKEIKKEETKLSSENEKGLGKPKDSQRPVEKIEEEKPSSENEKELASPTSSQRPEPQKVKELTKETIQEQLKREIQLQKPQELVSQKETKQETQPEPKQEEVKQETPKVESQQEVRQEPPPATPLSETKQELSQEKKPQQETNQESGPLKKESFKDKIKRIIKPKPDLFFNQTKEYFEKNNIEIIENQVIRKNSEIDFVVKVPSPVGALTYFCKAKNKKKISDGDLSTTFIQSRSRNLPSLFVTTGELTKRAKDMLEKEFKGMNITKL
ncbi:MAG: hypothetical protein QF824_00330 [Candidatus Woesearchaeota archaeon]|jgi:hypothetical protein|nr:hypothetical protein [Candidatus Woesearchaeota archaeon]